MAPSAPLLLALIGLWAPPAPAQVARVVAGEAAASSEEAAVTPQGTEAREEAAGARGAASEARDDPCDLDAEGNFIDWLNRTVAESVCSSARWFDSFFGTTREFDDTYATFGRLGLGSFWDEDDGIDPELRFRGRFSLPNVNRRWNAVLGRGSLDGEFEAEEAGSPAQRFFDEEEEWLFGFGFTAKRSSRSNLSLNTGASLSGGIDPYVNLRYVYQAPFTERSQFRIRIVPQWQDSKGPGYAVRPSIDHALNDDMLLRWGAFVKDFRERFDGFSYGSFLNLFHQLGPRDALRYRVGVISQSGVPHQPQDALGQLGWRTMVYKEMMIVESMAGVAYRRRPGEAERDPELVLGLVFELRFGE